MEDEVVEGEMGATDEAIQTAEVVEEVTMDAVDKDVVAESMVEEGAAGDAPSV